LRKLTVTGVCFSAIEDEDIKSLAQLPCLESLDIEVSDLTDTGLAAICSLRNLRRVRLAQTPRLTEQGLTQVRALKHLHSLTIDLPLRRSHDSPLLCCLKNLNELEDCVLPAGVKNFGRRLVAVGDRGA
jgi:hypothetical protein